MSAFDKSHFTIQSSTNSRVNITLQTIVSNREICFVLLEFPKFFIRSGHLEASSNILSGFTLESVTFVELFDVYLCVRGYQPWNLNEYCVEQVTRSWSAIPPPRSITRSCTPHLLKLPKRYRMSLKMMHWNLVLSQVNIFSEGGM